MKKKRRSFRRDERAVSPVIGVILMVAITVMMAAIIGAFVFGYTGKLTSAPLAQLSFTEKKSGSHNYAQISHEGGDAFNMSGDKIGIYLDGSEITTYPTSTLGPGGTVYLTGADGTLSTSFSAPAADLLNTGDDNETVVMIIDRESSQAIAKAKLTWA